MQFFEHTGSYFNIFIFIVLTNNRELYWRLSYFRRKSTWQWL